MRDMTAPSALRAVLIFHLRVGVRLSLRAAAPMLGLFVAAVGLSDQPDAFLAGIAATVAAPASSPVVGAILAALALSITAWAAPRLTHGLDGWIRHLPAAGTTHRRAAHLALAITVGPLLLLVAILSAGLALHGDPISASRVAGLPVLALAAAAASLPVRRSLLASILGTAGALLAAIGSLTSLLVAVVLVVIADRACGSLTPSRGAPRWRLLTGVPLSAVIAWRALRWRTLGAFAAPLIGLVMTGLFLRNNPLSPMAEAAAGRFGGALATSVLLAGLGAEMSVRRPVWPWARSLPWSASRRVIDDALFLSVHALPFVLFGAIRDPLAAAAVLAILPLLSLRAAGALRYAHRIRIGAGGAILAEGFAAAGVIALLPWSAALFLAAIPLVLRRAAARDRDQKVSRWIALHHQAAGDPLSWKA